ncbi:MAG: type I restriction enzyme HsdR N-terminal domain-containing protein [Cytophagales bacterium]|nr:type I restriction enzyme HsdR N-terminal domain-containing protein [Cytophagales bacterium]
MEYNFINQIFGDDDYEDIFEGFDFSILDDPDFKEDSVREEIVYPILKALGYSASGENKIIRSKGLKHPFYYFGTKKYNVNIIPDYTCEVHGKKLWILDAKRPSENIAFDKNVFQAYSYAMHPEIRCELYCLCNGKEFSVFSVKEHNALLTFKIAELADNWKRLRTLLNPEFIAKPHIRDFSLDLGLFILKIGGLDSVTEIIEFKVEDLNDITKIEENLYCINDVFTFVGMEDQRFMGTFDFNKKLYKQLLQILSKDAKEIIEKSLSRQPFKYNEVKAPKSPFSIHARLGRNIITNENESYLPFQVEKFTA